MVHKTKGKKHIRLFLKGELSHILVYSLNHSLLARRSRFIEYVKLKR